MLLLILLAPLLLAASTHAQTPTRGDTTIRGRTYSIVTASDLLAALRAAPAGTALAFRDIAVRGPLFAPTAAIDTVRARLHLSKSVFHGEVVLNNIVFADDVHLSDIEFQGGLSALKAHFNGVFGLVRSTSRKHTSFKQATFSAAADFSGTTFDQVASFIETRFASTKFAHARFAADAYFERTDFGSATNFRDAFFEDDAHFKNARWRDAADFGGARFIQRTRFWQARFDGPANFDDARSRGEISFNQAEFAGPVSYRRITFVHPVGFQRAVFHRTTTFADSRFKKAVDFSGARFHADLDLKAYFKSALDLRHTRGPVLDLLPPAGERAVDNPDSTFADTARVYMQHSDFARILCRWSQLDNRLAPIDSSGHDLLPVYARLAHHLRVQGLAGDARACVATAMDHRLRSLDWAASEWYGLHLWRLTTAYGTDLGRLALFAGLCVAIFALLYRLLGVQASLGASLFFSFQIFFRAYPTTNSAGPAHLLAAVQTLMGWLCLGFFVAALLA